MPRAAPLIVGLLLLAGVLAGGIAWLAQPATAPNTATPAAIIWTPDVFDAPFVSAPDLVAEYGRPLPAFPFKDGDRVLWAGSSSTYIGTWTRTVEFLIRTRQPELNVTFSRQSEGGGTFETCRERLPTWLERARPAWVVFNYGANEANFGETALEPCRRALLECVQIAQVAGVKALIVPPQSGDLEFVSAPFFFRRKRFADKLLELCRSRAIPAIDIHHPTERLQTDASRALPNFSINVDSVHLSDSAYVAWGYFFYERLNAPGAISSATLNAATLTVSETRNCAVTHVAQNGEALTFERTDTVWPILPPLPLPTTEDRRVNPPQPGSYAEQHGQDWPPRANVPLEQLSQYLLQVMNLPAGNYAIRCDATALGTVTATDLTRGINLNTLLLNAKTAPPWNADTVRIWNGEPLAAVRRTLRFTIAKSN